MRRGEIEDAIFEIISSSETKITPRDLENFITHRFSLTKNEAKVFLKALIMDEVLCYTYEFGRTCIETSFNKPVQLSKHVVIKPPDRHYELKKGEVVVNMVEGASFGTGRHPTTRLSVRGIEAAMAEFQLTGNAGPSSCVDLGTGTGILVITAVLLGMDRGVGVDIDPLAVSEALENVRLNGLAGKIQIYSQSVEKINGTYPLIIANLRYTALIRLFPILSAMLEENGFLVMSGIKSEELANVLTVYDESGYRVIYREEELGWAGISLKKNGQRRRIQSLPT
jgi:ribosomal protein L11 methyltransferase